MRHRDIRRASVAVTPRDVAHHEAGHAVAAWYFGYPIDFVTIEPAEDCACRRMVSLALNEEAPTQTIVKPDEYVKVLEAIDVCLAGHEADAVSTGRRRWRGSRRDRQIALALGARLCRDSVEIAALLAWRRIGTHAFVVEYADEIDALANALLKHGRLTGNQVRVAVNGALSRRSPLLEQR